MWHAGNAWFGAQMGFNEFLHRCELLDFDFDPKLVAQGRMHTRDMHKLKVRRCPDPTAICSVGADIQRSWLCPPLIAGATVNMSLLWLCPAQGDKYASRPVSELDVSGWEV